jgi:hypothetical protein
MRLQEPLRAGSRWREEPVLRPVDESDLAEYVTPDVTMIGNVVASARTVRLTLTIATRGQAAAALARTGSLPFVLSPLPAPLPPSSPHCPSSSTDWFILIAVLARLPLPLPPPPPPPPPPLLHGAASRPFPPSPSANSATQPRFSIYAGPHARRARRFMNVRAGRGSSNLGLIDF